MRWSNEKPFQWSVIIKQHYVNSGSRRRLSCSPEMKLIPCFFFFKHISNFVFVVFFFLQNGTDYGFLVRQNSELLRALDELEKTCTTLREENGLLVRLKITEFVVLTEGFLESRSDTQNRLTKHFKCALFRLLLYFSRHRSLLSSCLEFLHRQGLIPLQTINTPYWKAVFVTALSFARGFV